MKNREADHGGNVVEVREHKVRRGKEILAMFNIEEAVERILEDEKLQKVAA